MRASAFHRPLAGATPQAKAKPKASASPGGKGSGKKPSVELFRKNYGTAYKTWRQKLMDATPSPYDTQWEFMDAVHRRCETEATEEQKDKVNKTKVNPDALFNGPAGGGAEPARLFAHGLPGSGKTQVMLWLADYFETVWSWTKGRHFVYLAPLNSMAARIGGSTVHSWGEIPWIKDGPTGSMAMGARRAYVRDVSTMASKCELVRWVFIDEAEAVGGENMGALEHNTAEAGMKRLYKYRGRIETPVNLRPFGGINVGFFGDMWQLPPVRQRSICSNPFRELNNHHAKKMTAFFWGQDPCNGLTAKPFELKVSKRIKDAWYSSVIDECRAGNLSDDNYNFLHGYPTLVCGSWQHGEEPPTCGCQKELSATFDRCRECLLTNKHGQQTIDEITHGQQAMDTTKAPLSAWDTYLDTEKSCAACTNERQRRKRVLDDEETRIHKDFALAALVTPNNKPR